MVKYLTKCFGGVKPIKATIFLSAMLVATAVFGASDKLSDPTKPSSLIYTVGPSTRVATGPLLQTVLTSADRQRAVISGKTYKIGDRVGRAILIKLSVFEAVLKNKDGSLKILKIHAGLPKKINTQSQSSQLVQPKIILAVTNLGQNK